MRLVIFVLSGLLLVGINNLYAQDKEKNNLDSLNIGGQDSPEALAKMPIYNPKEKDAKILWFYPKGFIDKMPNPFYSDSLSKKLMPHLGKNLLENIPGDIYKKQKSDSTKQE